MVVCASFPVTGTNISDGTACHWQPGDFAIGAKIFWPQKYCLLALMGLYKTPVRTDLTHHSNIFDHLGVFDVMCSFPAARFRPHQHVMPSVLSMWVCAPFYRYVGRASGPLPRMARWNRRQWRLWICPRRRASGHAATATYGPSRRGAPRMRTQRLWTQTHFHPSLQATAPIPVSTSEVEVFFFSASFKFFRF